MNRCLQAQSAAAAAENSALDAAKYARISHCIKALTASQAAAQSFNLVCLCSCLWLRSHIFIHSLPVMADTAKICQVCLPGFHCADQYKLLVCARTLQLRHVLCLLQAKQVAGESAAAEARAAGAALRAVEAGIALYAERRDYLKLKDIAEASDVAGKVRVLFSFRTP